MFFDVNLQNADLKAQVDYIIITKVCAYFIECKNLVGNITINERGDFIREFVINSKKIKKGMYSPIRQVEAQRDVFRKIWESNIDGNVLLKAFKKYYGNKNFNDNYRVLVVTANNETILNTRYAPKDIKNKVIRSDALIRKIEEDIKYSDRNLWLGKKEMESWASSLLSYNVSNDIDYYDYYKSKFIKEKTIDNDNLKNKLINFRKERSASMNIPAYYVFTNEEIDRQLKLTLENLRDQDIIDDDTKLIDHCAIVMDPAYVHIEKETDQKIKALFNDFAKNNIYCIGRYGAWTYCSMEDCMLQAKNLYEKLS